MPPVSQNQKEGLFTETSWTVIANLQHGDQRRAAALESLCREYRDPLLAYARTWGLSFQDAEDVIQDFLADAVKRETFARADHTRGRLRTFLLSGLRQQVADFRRRQFALKRGGECQTIPLSEAEGEWQPLDEESPDKIFARKWMQTLFERARNEMREKWARSKREELFDALSPFLTDPLEHPQKPALTTRLQVTEGNLAVMLHRFRREFSLIARHAIADTVVTASEVEEELHELGWRFLD